MYDFLLVRHCNSILYHLRVIWRWIISWPWNRGYRIFKVIEIGAIRKLGCGFVFAFYSNCGRVCSCLWDIYRQRVVWPWNKVRVRSRSLKMAPFDRSHTSSYLSSIVTTAVSLAISDIFCVKEWRDLEMWVWDYSRSLKITRFDRLCTTFY